VAERNENDRVPTHVESATGSIAKLQADHHGTATRSDRIVEMLVANFGRPWAVWALTIFVIAWIAWNTQAHILGMPHPDSPPFSWLGNFASLMSLYLVILVLATQRRERVLAKHHEQLTLQLTMLSEQKTAKIIQLLQELRRDSPMLGDRRDPEADQMASPADPQQVIDAIRALQTEGAEPSDEDTSSAQPPSISR
jgi:uncharacterized membrane protein